MKNIIYVLIVLIILVLPQYAIKDNSISENQAKGPSLDWIIGSWVRQNDKKGRETFENWEKISNSEYFGRGFTKKNNKKVFEEEMKLKKKNGNWNLIVIGVNENPTIFKFSKHSKLGFVCNNDKNEFPKKIEYWMDGVILKARISDKKNEIIFIFKRLLKN